MPPQEALQAAAPRCTHRTKLTKVAEDPLPRRDRPQKLSQLFGLTAAFPAVWDKWGPNWERIGMQKGFHWAGWDVQM